jgi:hypothetical protein
MRRLALFFRLALALAVLAPALGAALAGQWLLALLFLLLGGGWGWGSQQWPDWPVATAGLSLLALLLVTAAAYDVAVIWLLPGMTAGLVAWDLAAWHGRLADGGLIQDEALLVRAHWRQLALVVGLALLLSSAALLVQVRLSFGLAFILLVLTAVALTRALQLIE